MAANIDPYKTMLGLVMFWILEVRSTELMDRKLKSLFIFAKS